MLRDVVFGEKLRLVAFLLPLVGDLLELLVVLGDFLFELLAKVLVVAKLALQLARERVERAGDGEGR